MVVAGYILFAVGFIACLVGEVMVLTVAFKRGLGWFLGCLFLPPLWLVLLAFHFGATIRPVTLAITGIALCCLGGHWAGIPI